MVLIDRIHCPENSGNPNLISIHLFSAVINLWALGIIQRQDIVDKLNISVADQVQLDRLATHYTNLTPNQKREFHGKLESLGIILENGIITKAQFVNLLGL